jgi:hypothetical protein
MSIRACDRPMVPAPAWRCEQMASTRRSTLPQQSGPTPLALPDAKALEEFVFHHDLVQKWEWR